MSDLIDRQAAIDAVSEACGELRGVFGRCEDAIKTIPSEQQSLYGYRIEHLALIARVMQKENVTPEKAIKCFEDIVKIVQMIMDEQKEIIKREVEKWTV